MAPRRDHGFLSKKRFFSFFGGSIRIRPFLVSLEGGRLSWLEVVGDFYRFSFEEQFEEQMFVVEGWKAFEPFASLRAGCLQVGTSEG
jgi:hypothetical protein